MHILKYLIAMILTGFMLACGGSGSDRKKEDTTVKKDITSHPDYQKGLTLVAKNKCLTCHAIDQMVTGPPYREIANKYAAYPDTIVPHLARKVINGGNGVWGVVFMTANAGITQEEAETMVRYILLLKN